MELFYCGNQWGYTPVGTSVSIPTNYCNPPINLAATASNQYVTFSWSAPHNYEAFQLEYRIVGDPYYTSVMIYGTNYKIPLQPLKTYEWQVRTVCSLANSRFSTFVVGPNVTTQQGIPGCSSVGAIGITNMGSFYRFAWFDTGAAYYKVYICPNKTNCGIFAISPTNVYDAHNLVSMTDYQVTVEAVCYDGKSAPLSPWVPFSVTNLNCYPPVNLNTTQSATSIVATWLPNPKDPTSIRSYNIYLNGSLAAANYPSTSFTFTKLTPSTDYKIEVIANCAGGFSQPLTKTVTTTAAVCECTITVLIASPVPPSSYQASWVVDCVPGSTLEKYLLKINNGAPIEVSASSPSYMVTVEPGKVTTITVEPVCVGGQIGTGKTLSFTPPGCGQVEPLTFDYPAGTHDIVVNWPALTGARGYKVEVLMNGGAVAGATIPNNTYTYLNAQLDTLYTFRVTPMCNINGTSTDGTVREGSTSIPTAPCIMHSIGTIAWKSATEITVDIYINPDPLATGRGRLVITDTAGNIIDSLLFYVGGTYTLKGLTEGQNYKIAAYDIPGGSVPATPDLDTCSHGWTDYMHQGCWVLQPSNIVVTQSVPTILYVNLIDTNWGGNQTSALVEWAYEGGTYNSVGIKNFTDFPLYITVPGYARYKVRISPLCNNVMMFPTISGHTCSEISDVTTQINGSIVTGEITPVLMGEYEYKVTLSTPGQTDVVLRTTTNTFTYKSLIPGAAYTGSAVLICDPDLNSNPYGFSFVTTGTAVDVGCAMPPITAIAADCPVIPPGGGAALACALQGRDWTLSNYTMIASPTNPIKAIFMEAVFMIGQSGPAGQEIIVPGGLLGVITAASCQPASTVDAVLEIPMGAMSVQSAGATIAVNGNITAYGTYTSSGGSQLMVRVRATYLKA